MFSGTHCLRSSGDTAIAGVIAILMPTGQGLKLQWTSCCRCICNGGGITPSKRLFPTPYIFFTPWFLIIAHDWWSRIKILFGKQRRPTFEQCLGCPFYRSPRYVCDLEVLPTEAAMLRWRTGGCMFDATVAVDGRLRSQRSDLQALGVHLGCLKNHWFCMVLPCPRRYK